MSSDSISNGSKPARVSRVRFDENGRIIPPTDEERAADLITMKEALAAMAAIPDDPPGSDEEFWRAMDEGRPHRPLFKHLYESP